MMDLVVPRDNGNSTSADAGWPRVSQHAYEAVLITLLPITILAVASHLFIKYHHLRHHLEISDLLLLLLALCCSIAAWVLAWLMRDLIYLQMELVLGLRAHMSPADVEAMVAYYKYWDASMVMNWTAVYAVKLAVMVCLKGLIGRVRKLEVYWWAVVAVLVLTWVFSAGFGFGVCPSFSMDYSSYCPLDSMVFLEETYLYTTTVVDIFTDLLIISLPIMLIFKVSISLKRKIILSMALCLGIFMIVICIVRVTVCKLSNGIIDSTWLALWQCIETNTAILIISLTAFRSLHHQAAPRNYITPRRPSKSSSSASFWPPSLRHLRVLSDKISGGDGMKERELNFQIDYGVLPQHPRCAVPFIRRGATEEEIDSQLLPSLDFVSDSLDSAMTNHHDLSRWSTWNHGKLEA